MNGRFTFPLLYPFYDTLQPKRSIAIDGISLTVAYVNSEGFTVSVIPHTFNNTVMRYRKVGDSVNLEVDLIARYLDQLVSKTNRLDSKLTLETSAKWDINRARFQYH